MGFDAENFSTVLPALTATPVWGSADAASSLPVITQSALGGPIWTASVSLPKITSNTSESTPGWKASMALPAIYGPARGISGGTGSADNTFPLLRSTAIADDIGFADLDLPLLTSSGLMYENVVFTANTTLPFYPLVDAIWEAALVELFTVWVMDAEAKGVSNYTSYNYNSFGKKDGVYFGVNANGIYRLDAEDDAGTDIAAEIQYAPSGFYYPELRLGLGREEATKQKRIASAYLVHRSDGDLKLTAKVDEDKYREYDIDTSNDPAGMHNRRTKNIGRGLKGLLWQFGVLNQNGADFELSALKVYPIVTSRRVV